MSYFHVGLHTPLHFTSADSSLILFENEFTFPVITEGTEGLYRQFFASHLAFILPPALQPQYALLTSSGLCFQRELLVSLRNVFQRVKNTIIHIQRTQKNNKSAQKEVHGQSTQTQSCWKGSHHCGTNYFIYNDVSKKGIFSLHA